MTEFATTLLIPDWPAPAYVKSLFTTRHGGVSVAPYDCLNLGQHVGDAPAAVQENRQRLHHFIAQQAAPGVRTELVFLQQVHGCDVARLSSPAAPSQPALLPAADAVLSTEAGLVCTIMVADCLPVLFAHPRAKVVAAAHAGWPGLAGKNGAGVIESTWQQFLQAVRTDPACAGASEADIAAESLVWLGPCIGPTAFEVGQDVFQAFVGTNASAQNPAPQPGLAGAPASERDCFVPIAERPGKWLGNLPALARVRLARLGITHIYGNDGSLAWCTFSQPTQYFSHRRDGASLGATGRMAVCIWLQES